MRKRDVKKPMVAYFCMEYGLHEDFRIYSGGLGILAGDILKAAKDLCCPMVGIGILWSKGYVTQLIDEDGKTMDIFKDYSYDFLEDTGVSVKVRSGADRLERRFGCASALECSAILLDTNMHDNPDRR